MTSSWKVDIVLDDGPTNTRIYELKVTAGRVLDVYQLLMAWDGLVEQSVEPTTGIYVCADYTPVVSEAIDAANKRVDNAGKPYNLEVRRISEMIPDP